MKGCTLVGPGNHFNTRLMDIQYFFNNSKTEGGAEIFFFGRFKKTFYFIRFCVFFFLFIFGFLGLTKAVFYGDLFHA
jgi:hypothetical protein